jgi:hypothetical protein
LNIYWKQTEVHSESRFFRRIDPVSVFENTFFDHLEKTGLYGLASVDESER